MLKLNLLKKLFGTIDCKIPCFLDDKIYELNYFEIDVTKNQIKKQKNKMKMNIILYL